VTNDYDPRTVRAMLLREGLSHLAHGLLLPFGFLRSAHRPLRRRDLRTLIFVHGFAGNRASLFPLQGYLRVRGHRRQYSYNYRSAGSVEGLALRLKQEVDRNVRGGRIDLIAHSMGGLVARYYLQALGGARRVDRLITLATPHRGTHSSAYFPSQLIHQLRPEGPFLEHLDTLPVPDGLRVVSFAAAQDLIVLPPKAALCPFGERHTLSDLGHLSLLLSPKLFAAVHRELERPLESRAPDAAPAPGAEGGA